MRVVPPEGSPAARYFIVGESPGQTEVDEGKPFCGPAGSVLNQILQAIKIDRRDCYVTNAVKVMPPAGADDAWWQKALVEWRGALAEEVRCAPAAPRAVLLLGGRVLQMWTGSQLDGGIFAWRGSLWRQSDLVDVVPRELQFSGNPLILPTLHPAFIMRGQWHLWPVVIRDAWRAFVAPEPKRPLAPPLRVPYLPSSVAKDATIVLDLETNRGDGSVTLNGLCDGATIWQAPGDGLAAIRLCDLLTSEKAALVGHNLIGFDCNVLDDCGIRHSGPYHDTITLANVVNPDFTAPREKDSEEGGRQTLAGLDGVSSVSANEYIQWKGMLENAATRRIVRRALGQDVASDLSPWDTLTLYNAIDLWMTWKAYHGLRGQLDEKRWNLFVEEQVANCDHRLEMRRRGMRFDVPAATAIRCRYARWIGRLERYVLVRAGEAWKERQFHTEEALYALPKCGLHKGFSRICATCAATVPYRKQRRTLTIELKKVDKGFNAQSQFDWRWLLYEVRGLSKYLTKRDRSPTGLPSIDDDVLLSILRKLKARGKDEPLIRARLRIARLRKRMGTYLDPLLTGGLLRADGKMSNVLNDFRTTSGRWAGGVSEEAK